MIAILLGMLLIAAPFIALFAFIVVEDGFTTAFTIFGLTALIMFCIFGGLYFISVGVK